MFPSLLPVAEWKKIGISASTECSSCCVLFPFLFLKKMNHETTTLKLQALDTQFKDLDITKNNLTLQFEQHSKTLASQAVQDEIWTAALALGFTSMELNILYSYVIEVLICLHTRMLQKLPDLVRSLPTLASVLRRKAKNKHVRIVWESVLEEYGLQERDVTALCTFFLVHGNKGEHYAANVRQMYIKDVSFMITNMVKNQALQDGLLRAVQIIEEGKAAQTPENSRAPLKELMPPVKD
ncbi:single-pass membrane and coiled-coil domain-containing protein 1 isoform X2 [Mastomys coucha]|uniref:single-pass membrane and coiled-coil domain-containing protein 1 isoform X2 n=1 Tax=Mastomys coucha TaxID=35658 RepID=UPI00126151A5|nr:single-pass membrane and coiled-coil domain-containing protein 1 isoform X2 [Mastomys coucha]